VGVPHHVEQLYVAVHQALGVEVSQRLNDLVHVKLYLGEVGWDARF